MSDPELPSLPEVPIGPQPDPAPTPPAPASQTLSDDASSLALAEALGASFRIMKGLMLGLVLLFFLSGVFVVKPNEVAIVLRFGKPVGSGIDQLLKPGWHFAFPYPIDEIVRVPIGQSLTVISTAGWPAMTAEEEALGAEPTARGFLSPAADGYAITADGNIMHVRATVKYRISDPLQYQFNFLDASAILTNVLNEAIIFAASRVAADDAIYKDKTAYRDLVLGRVRQKAEELKLGITLEPSDVETRVPADVKSSFDAVVADLQARSKAVSAAQGDRDEMLRKAVGEAQGILNAGISSSNRIVTTVQADVSRFQDLLPYYQRDPRLLEQRLLLATLSQVMTNAQDKFYLPAGVEELRLNLSREPLSKPVEETR